MAKLSIVAGATSQSVNLFIQNSSVTTGAGLTGLAFNTSSLIAYYTFAGANTTSVQIVLATLAAVTSAYSSGGFKEIDSTNMPGMYRLDIPNAALASSKGRSVVIMLSGATNMAPCTLEIELTAVDNQSTGFGLVNASSNVVQISGSNVSTSTAQLGVNVVNFGGTAVTGRDIGASVLLSSGTGSGQLSLSSGTVTVGTNSDKTGYSLSQSFPTNFSSLSIDASGRIDVGKTLGTAVTLDANSVLNVSSKYLAGTALTGRDIGASVLLSSGTSTGQLSITSGVVNSNVVSVASAASNIKKNQALTTFEFPMTDSTTHAPKTGVTVTATRSLDGAAFGACANAVSEVGNGIYTINLATTDLNANVVTLRFTGSGADDRLITIVTQP